MNIVIDESLKAYIDPLTPEEHAALEQSILAEGCRDALVLWGEVLVDGHNRYGICTKHDLPFQTVQNTRFQSMEDVHLWMIDQHLGRRSISDFQRGVLALRRREIMAARAAEAPDETSAEPHDDDASPWQEGADAPNEPAVGHADSAAGEASEAHHPHLPTRQEMAKAARISNNQMGMIEKIQKQAAPEVVEAVRCGSLSINAAAAVATLSQEEQREAAQAGEEELKQAAKRVREARRKPRPPKETEKSSAAVEPETNTEVAALQARIDTLTEENAALKQRVAELEAQLAD